MVSLYAGETIIFTHLIHDAMPFSTHSIRPFLGAGDFTISRNFYRDLGFEETMLGPAFSVFKRENTSFYLQDAYVKDWVDNTQLFLEVDDVQSFWDNLQSLRLTEKYPQVRIEPVRTLAWGKECFIHDPSGILWHVGEFH